MKITIEIDDKQIVNTEVINSNTSDVSKEIITTVKVSEDELITHMNCPTCNTLLPFEFIKLKDADMPFKCCMFCGSPIHLRDNFDDLFNNYVNNKFKNKDYDDDFKLF